jgi:hypothetical protein
METWSFGALRCGPADYLLVEVPLDMEFEKWTVTTPPADWQQLRERWEWWHVITSWVAVAGLALLVAGGEELPRSAFCYQLDLVVLVCSTNDAVRCFPVFTGKTCAPILFPQILHR